MKDKFMEVQFTSQLHKFLIQQGFTHVLSHGIRPKELNDAGEPETGKENYWLEPLKEDDPRLKNEESEQLIQGIKESDVYEMAEGQDEVQFMITILIEDYQPFLKDK